MFEFTLEPINLKDFALGALTMLVLRRKRINQLIVSYLPSRGDS